MFERLVPCNATRLALQKIKGLSLATLNALQFKNLKGLFLATLHVLQFKLGILKRHGVTPSVWFLGKDGQKSVRNQPVRMKG